jgi:hypothetical protein
MESKLVHSRRKWLFFIFFTALLLLSLIVAQLPSWREVVIELPDGSFTLSKERQEAIDEKISRYRTQTELYMLQTNTDSYYFCPACPPQALRNGKYFLLKNQVYKYGITINSKERYSKAELARWRLNYVILAVGNYTDMATKEVILNGSYPILPENLARAIPRRLSIPPGSGVALR